MGLLIDTNILIDLERGQMDTQLLTESQRAEPIFISVITVSELLYGVERAQDPAILMRRRSFVEGVISKVSILEIELDIARQHAYLSALLASEGKMIGAHDLWIAATCLKHDLKLITRNMKEFQRVPGLALSSTL